MSWNYEFDQECKRKAKIIAKHIQAVLKAGRENAMHRDDILLQLEHHGLPFELEEYLFDDAFMWLDRNIVKQSERPLYYLRKSDESRDGEWY